MLDEFRTQLWRMKQIWQYKPDPSWTHVPYLCAVAPFVKEGFVCEYGLGNYSTPVIHNLFPRHRIISYDNSRKWLDRFSHYDSPHHTIMVAFDWGDLSLPTNIALAFIDCAPGPDRQVLLNRLDGVADIIVLHDAESFTPPTKYRHVKVLGDEPPKTMLCANENILG